MQFTIHIRMFISTIYPHCDVYIYIHINVSLLMSMVTNQTWQPHLLSILSKTMPKDLDTSRYYMGYYWVRMTMIIFLANVGSGWQTTAWWQPELGHPKRIGTWYVRFLSPFWWQPTVTFQHFNETCTVTRCIIKIIEYKWSISI